MGRKYSIGKIGVFLTVVFAVILFSAASQAAVVYSGKLTFVEGSVFIGRQGSQATVPAKLGDSLFVGDNLKTEEISKAEITFLDNSVMRVSANSSMRISKFSYNKKEEKRNVGIRAFSGTFRFMVMKVVKITASGSFRPWRDSKFTVETPTAVVGVKGTDFVMEIDKKGNTRTTVLDGVVSKKSADPKIRGEVLIGKNKTSSVTKGAPPETPTDAPPEQLQALLDATGEGTETAEIAKTLGDKKDDTTEDTTEDVATEEGTTEEGTTDTTTDNLFGYTEGGLTTDTIITDTTGTTTGPTLIGGGGGTSCGTLPCI